MVICNLFQTLNCYITYSILTYLLIDNKLIIKLINAFLIVQLNAARVFIELLKRFLVMGINSRVSVSHKFIL